MKFNLEENDLEKYQKKHKKKQKGLSPFCYLPDPAKGIDTFNKNMGNDVSADASTDNGEAIAEDLNSDLNTSLTQSIKDITLIYIVPDASKTSVILNDDLTSRGSMSDEEVIVNINMLKSLLEGLQKCNSIMVEPTQKNTSFQLKYKISTDEYINMFRQIKVSDFRKAIRSTFSKYENDLLFVFHCNNIKLRDDRTDLKIYVKVNIDNSYDGSICAISFHELNQFESLHESEKPTYTFKYEGPIYRFKRYIENTKEPIYTEAQNEKHAATMIRGKLKKLLGLSYNSNLDIDEDKIELVNNPNAYYDEIV